MPILHENGTKLGSNQVRANGPYSPNYKDSPTGRTGVNASIRPHSTFCTKRETEKTGTTVQLMHFSRIRNKWTIQIPTMGSGTTITCTEQ